ncbi:hypothetical protein [Kitasatospora sp. NPDC086791]|uniref:hypothetical protein n=1 Tax=Kitasatospora sp. NPDC086791 TaxID=3155178 RepID=UPI003447F9B2
MSDSEEDGVCEAQARRIARLESEVEELSSANDLLRQVAEFLADRPCGCRPSDRSGRARPSRGDGPG